MKKIVSLLLAMVLVVSQCISTSLAMTSTTATEEITSRVESRAILGMSLKNFKKKLPSMGFDKNGWFGYDGAAYVEDEAAHFLLERDSEEFCKVIKECFNLLLPTEGDNLYNIVSKKFENRIYEMDGRTVKVYQYPTGGVTVDIYDKYTPEKEESITGTTLPVGMSFSKFKKELSGLGIKNDKYVENGVTRGSITATSTSAKLIIEKKSTKFNAVIKKALKMLLPTYYNFIYDEVYNGTEKEHLYNIDNREVKITRGSSKITIYISRLDIGDIEVREIGNYIYTGKSIEPQLTIEHKYEDGGGVGVHFLKKDKDYTVEFKNNKYPGTATITIKGKGNFKGSQTITFKIFPKKTTGVTKSDSTTSSIKLTWTKQSYVSGYEVYRSTSKLGKYERVGRITSNTASFTDSGRSSGKTYYYKVRSYKIINKKSEYGSNSEIFAVSTRCKTPVITLSSPKSKSAKVSWKKVSNATGYKIYRATSKKVTYKNIKTDTSGNTLSYTSKGLSSGKTYYYKVRAYRTVNGEKVYSYYTPVKSVKVK